RRDPVLALLEGPGDPDLCALVALPADHERDATRAIEDPHSLVDRPGERDVAVHLQQVGVAQADRGAEPRVAALRRGHLGWSGLLLVSSTGPDWPRSSAIARRRPSPPRRSPRTTSDGGGSRRRSPTPSLRASGRATPRRSGRWRAARRYGHPASRRSSHRRSPWRSLHSRR